MTTEAQAFLGEGDLLMDVFDPDTGTWWNAWQEAGEASEFAIQPKSDTKTAESRGRGRRGQVIASVSLAKPTEISITLGSANIETLRSAFMGKIVDINQASGTLTAQAVTAKVGKWVELGVRNLAATGLSVTNSDATTTYDLGTDFEINYRLGMIRALAAGDIADAASIKVTASYNAVDGSAIRGGTRTQIRTRLKLDGINLVDGSDAECEVYEAVLTTESAFDFLSENFADVKLKGTLVTPPDKTEPFIVRLPNR